MKRGYDEEYFTERKELCVLRDGFYRISFQLQKCSICMIGEGEQVKWASLLFI